MDGVISPWKDVDRHESHACPAASAAAVRVGVARTSGAAPRGVAPAGAEFGCRGFGGAEFGCRGFGGPELG